MIKILFIISYLSGGGAEHVARKNIECLSNDNNYEITILTSDRVWKPISNIKIYLAEDFRKKSGLGKVISTFFDKKNYNIMQSCLNEISPDIIHIHDYIPFSPSIMKAIRNYRNNNRIKVIMTHHTYSYICTNDSLYNYRNNSLCETCIGSYDKSIIVKRCTGSFLTSTAKYIQKNIYKKYIENLIDLHISPSEFLKTKLLKTNNKLNIQVVFNPCIENINNVSLLDKTDTIVFFGRVNREKNIISFTEAFCKSKCSMKFLIIGDGNASNEIKGLINEYPHKNIEFINKFIPTDQLISKIENARYFVLPSTWYENSPVSIIEGINQSVIPIVNEIGGMKELVQLCQVGIMINMSSQSAIINFLDKLDKKGISLNNCFEKNREILKLFTTENYKTEIKRIYLELVSE